MPALVSERFLSKGDSKFDESALASSLYRAGCAYYEGRGVSRDYGIAARLLRDSLAEAALPGDERELAGRKLARACYWTACEAADGGDAETAFLLYRESAEHSDPLGLCALGRCYRKGRGTRVDEEKGFELAGRAAKLGDFGGAFDLAMCCYGGSGVDRDYSKASSLFLQAADCLEDKGRSYGNYARCCDWAGFAEWRSFHYVKAKGLWERPCGSWVSSARMTRSSTTCPIRTSTASRGTSRRPAPGSEAWSTLRAP